MQARSLTLETEAERLTNNSMVGSGNNIPVGPGLRSTSEAGTGSSPSCDGGSADDMLLHRSNSLSSDGNTSPTSVMGNHHVISSASPASSASPLNTTECNSSEWNIPDISEVDFHLDLKARGLGAHVAPVSVEGFGDDIVGLNDAARIKRKHDSNEGICKAFDLDGGIHGGSTKLVPKISPTAIRTAVHVVGSLSSSSGRDVSNLNPNASANANAVEGDINNWNRCSDRSGEEDDRGQKDEYISSRRRRRLNVIVPNPRKPRTADYMCSLCTEMYQVVVGDNPWWAVYSQQCPLCKQQQVPRIDINSASNAIELDPNVMALYGEGVEDSGDDECEAGSEEEEEVEKEEDDDAVAAAAEADEEDLKRDVHPFDGEGLLAVEEASKLLVLMCHARSCTGQHASPKHAEICKVRHSNKYLAQVSICRHLPKKISPALCLFSYNV